MLKYNFILVKRGSELLLLNRDKPSWMGCWNGVGGKVEEGEGIRASALRELDEETGLRPDSLSLTFKGIITWTVDDSYFGGMYTYLAELAADFRYDTPVKTAEGILDWKREDWIMHPENMGIAKNIPLNLHQIMSDSRCYDHHNVYRKGEFVSHCSRIVDAAIEEDAELREAYLRDTYELCRKRRHG